MLSSPWSLEFVLAVIIGALLVPGCRANNAPADLSRTETARSPRFSSSQAVQTVWASRSAMESGRPETPPAVLVPVGLIRLRLP